MDMNEAESGTVTVTGEEGWSAQQGEAIDEDESDDSVDIDMPRIEETQGRDGCSRPKRKRKEVDPFVQVYVARNAILQEKNRLFEKMVQMMERDQTYRVEHVVKILNELPGVIKWSPFHIAALKHLIADVANRQGFMAFSSADDKICYLEYRTGIKLSGGL
ncbi:uncharacterized protein LOC108851326 [Raphanus sativus]|uniref:Uncharacterized protein LOC108851326 n=1 Tax=Raphanus sativus TaxID=3726 RepID=A0A6J0N7V2_RAPSA|nr:uncharacterized protein LOC108851326 [Raphanus sativus]